MAHCPYYQVEGYDEAAKRSIARCTLIDQLIIMPVDCKKCITDPRAREHMWESQQHHIKARLFSQIPNKWKGSIQDCEHRGAELAGVTRTARCCGGKTHEVPLYECKKHSMPVSNKECLECFAGKSPKAL